MPASKNRIKQIRALEQKKTRKATGLFVAEGPKTVEELLPHFRCTYIAATEDWMEAHRPIAGGGTAEVVTPGELARMSLLKAPQNVLAVLEQRTEPDNSPTLPKQGLCLALDDVQDPGNLGTIIRIADWFGIRHIFCSLLTADAYNPKVVQATMGSLARVHLHYVNLRAWMEQLDADTPIYGTFLDGRDIYTQPLSDNGLIVMGNEGNGIGEEVRELINRRLYIPPYPKDGGGAESLNVAVATAVVCAEFRRRC